MKSPNNPLRLSLLNSTRAPAYARTDVRATFAIAPWLEVYGEIVNLFGRENFHPTTDFRGHGGALSDRSRPASSPDLRCAAAVLVILGRVTSATARADG